MRGSSSPSAVALVAALASVMCLPARPAYAAMPMAPHRLGAVDSGPVSRAGAVGSTVRRNDAATAAYQDRLNSALQTMLDAVVGPGRAVVTTTAELNFDQVETISTTYARDPAAGALSERISSRAYAQGTDGTRYESTSTARANALNSLRETRRTAPGRVEKLNIAVLVDATAGRTVDLAQLTELVSVAAGVEAGRGDTVAVAAMPMRPGVGDTAASTLAEPGAATAGRRWVPAAAAVALLILIGVMARRRYRRTAAQRDDLQRMRAAVEGRRPVVATADLAAPAPGDPRHDGIERQRRIERLAGDDPGQAAAVLRGWTGSDR